MDITLWDKAATTFPEDDILTADQEGPVILAFLSTSSSFSTLKMFGLGLAIKFFYQVSISLITKHIKNSK